MRPTALSVLVAFGLFGAAVRIASPSHVSIRAVGTREHGELTGSRALGAIVGEWQSDTVDGVSARTKCAWSPYHAGVVCEQHLQSPNGASTALDLFTADSATAGGRFTLYVLQKSGEPMTAVPFVIEESRWIYGGASASGDGRYYRTVNEFRHENSYTWRQEVSSDGKTWSEGIHGRNVRIRR